MNHPTFASTDRARVKRPERAQIEWRPMALDQLLPSDHRARVVWRYVDSPDLLPLYQTIQAVEGKAGRDAVDPSPWAGLRAEVGDLWWTELSRRCAHRTRLSHERARSGDRNGFRRFDNGGTETLYDAARAVTTRL